MSYVLQSRWRLEDGCLKYYGLRNRPYLFKNTVKLSPRQKIIVETLPRELDSDDIRVLGSLVGVQIVKSTDKKNTSLSGRGKVLLDLCR